MKPRDSFLFQVPSPQKKGVSDPGAVDFLCPGHGFEPGINGRAADGNKLQRELEPVFDLLSHGRKLGHVVFVRLNAAVESFRMTGSSELRLISECRTTASASLPVGVRSRSQVALIPASCIF